MTTKDIVGILVMIPVTIAYIVGLKYSNQITAFIGRRCSLLFSNKQKTDDSADSRK